MVYNLHFTTLQKHHLLYRAPDTHLPTAVNVYPFIRSSGKKAERIEHKILSMAFYRHFTQ